MYTKTSKEPVARGFVLFDLAGQPLGRAATRIADIIRGKHKATFTPNVDTGDFVVAINASKVKLTGKKMEDKMYYWHSRFIGGLRESNAERLLTRHPEEVVRRAVKGMLPKNDLAKKILKKLKVYAGSEHPHAAQIKTVTKSSSHQVSTSDVQT